MPVGRLGQRSLQQTQLAAAAHEWRLPATRQAWFGRGAVEAPDLHRLRLALQLERFEGRELEGVGRQAPGGGADEDAVRLRRLLEARGHVHRVAGHGVLVRLRAGSRAADHLARVDADPDLEPLLPHRLADGQRGMERALRVVVVGLRRAVDRHHRVADVLLDGAAIALDLGRHGLEVGALDLANLFGVARLGPAREADEVDEQHRDEASLFADGHGRIVPDAVRCPPVCA